MLLHHDRRAWVVYKFSCAVDYGLLPDAPVTLYPCLRTCFPPIARSGITKTRQSHGPEGVV